MNAHPIHIDEQALRPEWGVWLMVGGELRRTRPCWEVNVGEAFAGPRGASRLPALFVRRVKAFLFGPDPFVVHRDNLKRCFYEGDQTLIDSLTVGEVTLVAQDYAVAEAEWHAERNRINGEAYARLFREREAQKRGKRGGDEVNVIEYATSQEQADAFASMPGVRDNRPKPGAASA